MPTRDPDFAGFITTIDKLTAEITAHKAQLTVADRRSRWARTAALVGIVVGVVGAAVGIGGLVFGVNAQATADDLAESRRDTQVSACVQANVTTEKTRAAFVHSITLVANANKEATENPERDARIDALVDAYKASVNDALPYRDCSPAGIATYFAHPPADPATTTTTGR